MSFKKPAYQVIRERLTKWYLFQRKFPVTFEEFLDMVTDLDKPAIVPAGKQKEWYTFMNYVSDELQARKGK